MPEVLPEQAGGDEGFVEQVLLLCKHMSARCARSCCPALPVVTSSVCVCVCACARACARACVRWHGGCGRRVGKIGVAGERARKAGGAPSRGIFGWIALHAHVCLLCRCQHG